MKKISLVFGLMLCTSISSIAQTYYPTEPTIEESLKATKGGLTTEFGISPEDGKLTLNKHIKARYFTSDNLALRFGISGNHRKLNDEVLWPYGNNPPNVASEMRTSEIALNFGFEKHFPGTRRLSPYAGTDLMVAFKRSRHEEKDNENSFNMKGSWFIYNGNFSELNQRAFNKVGLILFIGCDYYIGKNFYFGYEMSYLASKTFYRKIEVQQKGYDNFEAFPNLNQLRSTETNFGKGLMNGIRFGYFF